MPLERMWLRRPHARCSARDHRGLEAGSAVQGGGHDARRRADLDSGEAHKLRAPARGHPFRRVDSPGQSFHDVEEADRLLVVGTTLATYSAFRLLKHAVELNKPVLLLNVGPSRGDDIEQIDRIDMASGLIIRDVVRAVLGTTASEDPVIAKMLESGIVKPPEDDTRPAEVVLSK